MTRIIKEYYTVRKFIDGESREFRVEVQVDMQQIAEQLAGQAYRNTHKKAQSVFGAVKVKVVS